MWINIIGVIGVSIVVLTYLLLQLERINANGFGYSFLNALGSLMILYSLTYNWNLASVIIEFFWIVISLFGLYKWYTNNKKEKRIN
ncbi:CBU_0592 family membrane protein [Candidatus Marinarcus aquaticus]|uniref:CBU-0592-like domain-containing protein n=1 Tax=Candidatus Marinarcus aquaticus TaxID=2044504 RepID=A0A4Q0XN86_9BACT|nr:hypothetical protein [Candidatus Marinarcus aquaticus]RXJ55221.1 hypothetical protein CRV04_10280 [Candidatus Marinarcus aquaticus]